MRRLSLLALNRALLARQFLLRRQPCLIEEAVERLVGLQAQAPLAPYVGLWSRLDPFDPVTLGALIAERRAIRTPLFRATLHLVTDRDGRELRPLVQPVLERAFRSTPYGKNLIGVDLREVAAAGRAQLTTPQTRAELGRNLAERFPDRDPLSLAYAVTYLVPVMQVPPRGVWKQAGVAAWATYESRSDAATATETSLPRAIAASRPGRVAKRPSSSRWPVRKLASAGSASELRSVAPSASVRATITAGTPATSAARRAAINLRTTAMHFTGVTAIRVQDGLITEEIGLDDGVAVLQQLGIIPQS